MAGPRASAHDEGLGVYGSDAGQIARSASRARVHPALRLTFGEVRWHVREEMARTVEDVLARRSRCLLLDARASIEAAPAVARVMAEELGRDEPWIAAQTRAYRSLARGYVFGDPASLAPGGDS